MTTTVTILGCGSSGGVPRIGNQWGACDPANPRNRRRRCSVLVRKTTPSGTTTVLIDTSPDLREQLLDAGAGEIDGVVFSHPHADHTHGIDELRVVALNMRRRVEIWADKRTTDALVMRFGYAFATPPGSSYPAILNLNGMEAGKAIVVGGKGGDVDLLPFQVNHGDIDALGFRIGTVAYTPDLNGVPDASRPALQQLSCWIVDALRRAPHPSHWSLQETLTEIARFRPQRAIITNMHVDLDYETLRRELPGGTEPAYDGLTVEIP
ncbi:MAG TPA: MBL fold metallo-hydrolase [Aestuariivirgaceae bacterium]|nr:MBL fold metallo-hydrolase [Aestuariivirgaceae bacterium]